MRLLFRSIVAMSGTKHYTVWLCPSTLQYNISRFIASCPAPFPFWTVVKCDWKTVAIIAEPSPLYFGSILRVCLNTTFQNLGLMLLQHRPAIPHASVHKSFEVYRMQSDCPAVMHAALNNGWSARGVGKGRFNTQHGLSRCWRIMETSPPSARPV